MRILIKTTLLLLSSILLASCGIPDIRIKRKVAEGEIVGTWQLAPNSSALAEDYDGENYVIDSSKPHTIVFSANGTCRYRSVLQMPTRHIDAAGKWKVAPTSDDPKGSEIDIRLDMSSGGTYMFNLSIKEESGELILWDFWSDPDLCNFLEYKRKNTEPIGSGQ